MNNNDTITLPRNVVEQALEALTNCTSEYGHRCNRCDSEVDPEGNVASALRAALEQPQGEQGPVPEHELKDVRCECCGYMTHQREHMGCIRAVQPRGKPLSYEKIRKAWNDAEGLRYGYEDFARAIERAHGIEGEA